MLATTRPGSASALSRRSEESRKPLAFDLYCGLGGWSDGLIAEGYRVIGFDIERHDYGTGVYPGQLVLQDILTLHGSQLKGADLIVASPPCQFFSRMAMPFKCPWKPDELERRRSLAFSLFEACFRIQKEASEAAGHHIPMVVENVKGAQKWIGRAKWHYGSFYLWGDVPALMPTTHALKNGELGGGSWFGISETNTTLGMNPDGRKIAHAGKQYDGQRVHGEHNDPRDAHLKVPGLNFSDRSRPAQGFNTTAAQRYREGVKQEGSGPEWFDKGIAKLSSRSDSRKAASAAIAKIPFPLAQHIARVYKPNG